MTEHRTIFYNIPGKEYSEAECKECHPNSSQPEIDKNEKSLTGENANGQT